MKKNIIFLFFLLLFTFLSNAQQPLAIHLTEKDGLPDIEFYDIFKDDKGFIWLAADKGLYKYDGRTYQLFEHPLKRGRSLFSLKQDKKGRIWCNNLAGQFFYVEKNKLHLFENFAFINNLIDYYIFKNYLVLNNIRKLYFIDIDSKKIVKTIHNVEGFISEELNNQDKEFFYSSKNNIFKITDLETSEFINKIKIEDKFKRNKRFGFELNSEKYVLQQSEKELDISITKIANKSADNIFIPHKLSGKAISKLAVIGKYLFIATNKGVLKTAIINNKLKIYNWYFKDKFITDVVLDKDYNYWFSTLKNGIFIIPNEAIKNYNNVFQKVVLTEKKDEKTIFIANGDGEVLEFDLLSKKIKKLNFITNTVIKTLLYNKKNNTLIIGSSNYSVNYNLSNNTSTPFKSNNVWKSISYVKKNKYVVSTPNNFSEIDILTQEINPILKKRSYASLYLKKENSYYTTMIDGLVKYNIGKKKETYLLYNNQRVYGSKLAKLQDGTIWIATHNKGLLAYKNNKFIDSLVLENGLASTVINSLKAHDNKLWIATDRGLQSYNSTNKTIKTLSKTDGLNTYGISNLTFLDSLVFASTNKDLLSFHEDKVFKKRNKPILYLTNLFVNDSIKIFPEILEIVEGKTNFKVEFNCNGFQSLNNIVYEYVLEGLSNKWTTIDNLTNFIKFNSLPAGKFLLKIRARNIYDKKYSNTIKLPIVVTKPFYKTFWFLLLILIFVVFLVYSYFKKQNSRLKKEQKIAIEKAEISKELVFSQLENLRSQMNPHFIFNALNSIQDFIILNEKKLARQYLVKFSKLIRIYLEQSQKNEITLEEEIKALQLYLDLEKDRFNDGLFYEINVDKALNTSLVYLPSLFLQPYVENSLKHGLLHKTADKKVQIDFIKNKENLVCTIIDNGIGRAASAEINKKRNNKPKSFATSANQKRIDLLNLANKTNLTLQIEDLYKGNVATGTKVIINIPEKK